MKDPRRQPWPLVAATLLIACALLGAGETIEFAAREGAQLGWIWLEEARWHTIGRTKVKLGPLSVRDKENDQGVDYRAVVELTGVGATVSSAVRLRFERALRFEGEDEEPLDLLGAAILGQGVGPDRKYKREAGRRIKGKEKSFLQNSMSDRSEDDLDPVQLLLPPGPVSVGDHWLIDLEGVVDSLGRDRFTLDYEASRAEATLIEVLEREGARFGKIGFDVLILPATIKDMDFERARLTVRGSAELPLRGDLPYRDLDVVMAIHFKGTVKRMGVRAKIEMDNVIRGKERRSRR